MGYAFDPMQKRWNALRAGLLLGALWAMWHLPFYLAAGHDALRIVAQSVGLLALRMLIVWIYGNTGRSVFAAILIHAVYNVCTLAFPSFYISIGHLITSILIVVAAVIVALLWDAETLTQPKSSSC
jgi:CAAX protease family protein